jgi:arylsulfatase A-like enzyme
MGDRSTSRAVGVLGMAALVLFMIPGCEQSARNVVFVSLDTTRRDHLSAYGYERDTSPSLRRLAEAGVLFENAIATHTNTAPSHASMFTGLYPGNHGIDQNGRPLADGVTTLAEVLGGHGFATAAFVSGWTLNRHTQLQRGFDVFEDDFAARRRAERTLALALPWLRERVEAAEPFFLFVHFFDPHYPYNPPGEYARRFLPEDVEAFGTDLNGRDPGLKTSWGLTSAEYEELVSRHDGEIAYADHHVGLLMDELDQLGVARDTLVILTADHGETLDERAWIFDHGGRAYDEQIRVPLIIRLPAERHAGKQIASQVSHVDLMPTILSALRLPVPEELTGKSLLELMKRETDADRSRPAFSHARPEPARIPEVSEPLTRAGLVSTVRLPGIKLIEYPKPDGGWYPQLFDLDQDPGETRNLAEARTEQVAALHQLLERWRAATGGDRVPPPLELEPEVAEGLRALGYLE